MRKFGFVAGVFALCVLSGCGGFSDEEDGSVTQGRPVFSGTMDDCTRFPSRC